MANLLGKQNHLSGKYSNTKTFFSEVSKGDEIMPAIKTLKLLAHGDYSRSNSQTRPSSSKPRKNSLDHPLPPSKSSSQTAENIHENSEPIQTGTDDGES